MVAASALGPKASGTVLAFLAKLATCEDRQGFSDAGARAVESDLAAVIAAAEASGVGAQAMTAACAAPRRPRILLRPYQARNRRVPQPPGVRPMPREHGPLDVTFCVSPGEEGAAARQARARMRPHEWEALCRLAAAVVAMQEEAATGQVYLVAPVSLDHLAAVVKAQG